MLAQGLWPSSLFDVCSAGPVTCFLACVCPCVQFGINNGAFKELQGEGLSCCCAAFTWSLLTVFSCALHNIFREQVRHLNRIHSDNDCCITICCPCCAMIQEATLLQSLLAQKSALPSPQVALVLSPVRVRPIPDSPVPCNAVQSTPMALARFLSPQRGIALPTVSTASTGQSIPQSVDWSPVRSEALLSMRTEEAVEPSHTHHHNQQHHEHRHHDHNHHHPHHRHETQQQPLHQHQHHQRLSDMVYPEERLENRHETPQRHPQDTRTSPPAERANARLASSLSFTEDRERDTDDDEPMESAPVRHSNNTSNQRQQNPNPHHERSPPASGDQHAASDSRAAEPVGGQQWKQFHPKTVLANETDSPSRWPVARPLRNR